MILRCPDFRGEREKSMMIEARVSALAMMEALKMLSKVKPSIVTQKKLSDVLRAVRRWVTWGGG